MMPVAVSSEEDVRAGLEFYRKLYELTQLAAAGHWIEARELSNVLLDKYNEARGSYLRSGIVAGPSRPRFDAG
jgi:hypothetical protein